MELLWMELYKILRRRMLWIGLALIVILGWLWLGVTVSETDTVVDGVRYTGLEAVRKDREIARQWEGTLTLEKLYDMIDAYGLAVNEGPQQGAARGGNWVSRYATEQLTDYKQRGNSETAEFWSGEELENLRWKLETYKPWFCYIAEADFLTEMGWFLNILLLFLTAVCLAPVYTEEYQCGTAPILLTTVYGKRETLRAKLFAAVLAAEGMYVVVDGILFLSFLAVYGTDGLRAGAALLGVGNFSYWSCPVWQIYVFSLFLGASGVAVMAVTTLLFSAACRQTFAALAGALLFLAGGYFLVTVVMNLVPFWTIKRLILILGDYNPIVLLLAADRGPGNLRRQFVLVAVGIVCSVCMTGKKWQRCEG